MKWPALLLAACTLAASVHARADSADWQLDGHLKYRFNGLTFPDDSIFREPLGSSASDHGLETRLRASWRNSGWDIQADYQLIGIHSDTLQLTHQMPGTLFPGSQVINDDRRWFNLTRSLADSSRSEVLHRLDRVSIGYAGDHLVWRFGRQAISWGNGMMFNPMDIFNPFDPAAVDTEYKTGDDMVYGQYLFDNGNDLQGVAVVRRNPLTGDVEREQSSLAFKYHGFAGMNEYDLLLASHYDDLVLGVGGNVGLGGAVWRGDLTWTDTRRDTVLSAVTSLSYSWIWGGKNVSGVIEYYYNGFGQPGGDYSPADLLANPDLLARVARGELFTLGRHYLGASATVEVTPLFLLTPSLFLNLEDPSGLLQLLARYDWRQDLQILLALNLPMGDSGTEYGGIDSPVEHRYFSTGPNLTAQLAWYF